MMEISDFRPDCLRFPSKKIKYLLLNFLSMENLVNSHSLQVCMSPNKQQSVVQKNEFAITSPLNDASRNDSDPQRCTVLH